MIGYFKVTEPEDKDTYWVNSALIRRVGLVSGPNNQTGLRIYFDAEDYIDVMVPSEVRGLKRLLEGGDFHDLTKTK